MEAEYYPTHVGVGGVTEVAREFRARLIFSPVETYLFREWRSTHGFGKQYIQKADLEMSRALHAEPRVLGIFVICGFDDARVSHHIHRPLSDMKKKRKGHDSNRVPIARRFGDISEGSKRAASRSHRKNAKSKAESIRLRIAINVAVSHCHNFRPYERGSQ